MSDVAGGGAAEAARAWGRAYNDIRRARVAEGRAYALAWRARMKPYFDTVYGPDPNSTLPWRTGKLVAGPLRAEVADGGGH